ncbi:hypothetical protein EG68_04907 [Paragonimus skrjabini miyazakii]|uniref:Uncharacterized protein n=1 Tax=Paragonimus skrjabini miyazakii TaxID=59628 RepID=A0A8S9YP01_9TREM|nr:hypothetical protein EG68_04907 [Paragonimus skrjabini miyazakii]
MLACVFVFLWSCTLVVHSTTLEQGLKNPSKYIHYELAPYSIWVHGAIALSIMYGTLTSFILFVHFVVYVSGSKRGRRSA